MRAAIRPAPSGPAVAQRRWGFPRVGPGRRGGGAGGGGVDVDDASGGTERLVTQAAAAETGEPTSLVARHWAPLVVGSAVVAVFVASGARDFFESGFDPGAWAAAVGGGGWRLARLAGGAVASFLALYALREACTAAVGSPPGWPTWRSPDDPTSATQLAMQLWT